MPKALHMTQFLEIALPGFRWLSVGSFILGLVEAFLYGAYAGSCSLESTTLASAGASDGEKETDDEAILSGQCGGRAGESPGAGALDRTGGLEQAGRSGADRGHRRVDRAPAPGSPVRVRVSLDTHSAALDGIKFENVVTLGGPDGGAIAPTAVEQAKGAGHHREAVLAFPPLPAGAREVRITVKNVGGVGERDFKWELPIGR
jgi:hypothetical protein